MSVQFWTLLYIITVILAGWLIGYFYFHTGFGAGKSWEEFKQYKLRIHIMALRNFLLLSIFWPIALAAAIYTCWREGDYK